MRSTVPWTKKKDQSYFLYRLNPAWLPRLRFPVGGMQKADVWAEAEALGLPVDELKESQEICFVSHGDYRTFIESEMPDARRPGDFVDGNGRYLGRHDGIAFYTPGQRRGLGIAAGQRLLLSSACHIQGLNLFDRSLCSGKTDVTVKIRYATPATAATVEPIDQDRLHLAFRVPQRALSPGQSAVLYHGDRVLGGGMIQAV